MGVARDLVGQPGDECAPPQPAAPSAKPQRSTITAGSIIARATALIDDLDRCIQVKQKDLEAEGRPLAAENHYKLGILKGADSLLRRARAMLQDYGTDLDLALNPTTDAAAAGGSEIEGEDDLAHFGEPKDN